MSTKHNLIIDDDEVPFCRSECECDVCKRLNSANDNWGSFVPATPLERRMADVISRIVAREEKNSSPLNELS